ncbi:MAG: hypothetical protein HC775_04445 [Hyellaceae cyanobacterium CSU_1_1]|nr:hypothetical protein [Pleurocapsa sp. CRU_1_2]NJR45098.1 hypothetical protein [Hyellaceae cyanobacterium CSU_1_1]
MSHFNVKTLSFYGVAIGSVLLLFKVVSAYGETKLKAPQNIDGSYQFVQTENLPDCLQGQQLKLNVEQSGVYLFGNLEVASPGVDDDRAVQPKSSQGKGVEIPFNGSFENNQIIMSGKGNVANCDSQVQLTVQGQHKNGNLVGQINDNVAKTKGAFVAKFQKSKLPSAESTEGH